MDDSAHLTAAVARARRRLIANQALHQAVLATTIALFGPTLLLLLGRHWVGGAALVGFVVAGIGLAGWRIWRGRPEPYSVAQTLDARLASQDQISTAVYFLPANGATVLEQRRAAERIAERSAIESAFPFTFPRATYGLAGVFLAASALWAIRYFLEKPVTLERPLAQVISQVYGAEHALETRAKNAPPERRQPSQKEADAFPFSDQQRVHAAGPEPGKEVNSPGDQDRAKNGENGGKPEESRGQTDAAQASDEFGDPMASPQDQPIQSYEDMLERDAKSGLSKAEGKDGKEADGNGNDRNGSSGNQESNSLLSKLRDAMNQMLSKLQQKSAGKGAQQQAANGSPSESGEQQDGKGEGRSGAGQPQPGGQESSEGEGGEGESKDGTPQGASAKAGGKSADGGSRNSSGEGAGQQDGEKQVTEAEQQEVLGKLSELYGRRAANVSGEVTVETQPGKQTLRTPQTQKAGRHTDSGGQVSRDEIPLAYQAYVKEYFNRLRQSDKK